jgi:hypothetical protein
MDVDVDITFAQALPLLQAQYKQATGRKFNVAQLTVLEAAWSGTKYQAAASGTEYSYKYLQNACAPKLWKTLTKILNIEISKDTFKEQVLRLFIAVDEGRRIDDVKLFPFKVIGTAPKMQGELLGRRDTQKALLHEVIGNRCVLVHGAAGVGKTALCAELLTNRNIASRFDFAVWKHCISSNPIEDIQDLMQLLNVDGQESASGFTELCRKYRLLICLDGIDRWFQDRYRADDTIRRFVETEHKSCILITAREPLLILSRLARDNRLVNSLFLRGLPESASLSLLASYGLKGERQQQSAIARGFLGNPGLLHHAAQRILDLYRGQIGAFLQHKTSFAGDEFTEYLDKIFNDPESQIYDVDRQVLAYIASFAEQCISQDNIVINLSKELSLSSYQIYNSINKLQEFALLLIEESELLLEKKIYLPSFVKKYLQKNISFISNENCQVV